MPKKNEPTKEEQELQAKKAEFWGKLVDLEKEYNLKIMAMLEYRVNGILPVIGLGEFKAKEDNNGNS